MTCKHGFNTLCSSIACTLLIFKILLWHLLKGFSITYNKIQKERSTCKRMLWHPSSGVEPLVLVQPLPSNTEAVLVAVVTPNAPFRHLILVFPLFWQLPGNGQLDLPVKIISI